MKIEAEPNWTEMAVHAGLLTEEQANAVPNGPEPWLDRCVRAGLVLAHQAAFVRTQHPGGTAHIPTAEFRIPGFDGLMSVGRGASATVYRAVRAGTQEVVALKVYDSPDALQLAESEAALTAQIDHPHVVKILDRGQFEGRPFLVMEFIEGEDLACRMSRSGGAAPLLWSTQLIARIADAVGDLHGRGIVHKDIKPSNILVGPHDTPFLTDLGLAAQRSNPAAYLQKAGTMAYAAPECSQPDIPLSPPSDVYSLCTVLAEMVSGVRQGGTDSLLPPAPHRSDDESRLAGLPQDLRRILKRGLARDPWDRYPDGHALAAHLWKFSRGEPVLAGSPTLTHRVSTWMETHSRRTRAVGIALLLSMVGGLYISGFVPARAIELNNEGMVYFGNGNWKQALECFDRAIEMDPQLSIAYSNRGGARFNLGDPNGAIADCSEALRLVPAKPQAYLAYCNRALARRTKFDLPGAIADMRKALDVAPRDWNQRGTAQGQLDQWESLDPYTLATQLVALKRYDEAIPFYERAVAARPDDINVIKAYASALIALDRHDDAFALYERAIARHPDDIGVTNAYASALIELKRYDEAFAIYERTIATRPGDINVIKAYAAALIALKRYEQAFPLYEGALAKSPDDISVMNSYAYALAIHTWPSETCPAEPAPGERSRLAVELASRAMEKAPPGGEPWEYRDTLAAALYTNGEVDRAITTEEEALREIEKLRASWSLLRAMGGAPEVREACKIIEGGLEKSSSGMNARLEAFRSRAARDPK